MRSIKAEKRKVGNSLLLINIGNKNYTFPDISNIYGKYYRILYFPMADVLFVRKSITR